MTALTPDLTALADASGVATTYEDYRRRPVDVEPDSVRLALAAMGVAADSDTAVRHSLESVREARLSRLLPPTVVVRAGEAPDLRLPGGAELDVVTEAGERPIVRDPRSLRELPPGYHRLHVATPDRDGEAVLVVAPPRCPVPLDEPGWGWMVQLYQARSRTSWGMGDYADLRALTAWSAGLGAAMLLVNPLHAPNPTLPQTDSPYYPSSRRFRSPLYLRIEELPELDRLPSTERERVTALAAEASDVGVDDLVDRDRVFRAKNEALELLFRVPRSDDREASFRAWKDAEGRGARDFATFCALAEQHGTPWQSWPAELRHPSAPAVTAAAAELGDRVAYHEWLQWLCDTQLAAVDVAARESGMTIGVVHDLAVGVDPGGADSWALQDDLAHDVTVGAPPDGFNQQGQDWGLPPLRPDRLATTGYAPFRDMVRSVLRHAGGIRIDHVMGLWRLWWVPQGRSAAAGTYVRYPADDLLGVLALEADRAGALVVGEDLGTVQQGVRETMARRGVLSSRVVYFERVDDDPDEAMLPPVEYPQLALTSITTHDLPTAAGWWADEDIRVQTELGLFGEATTPQAQAERKAGERSDMLAALRREGLVGDDPDDRELVVALHAFLARTPSLLIASGLGDALGDRRQPNMPGTTDTYPNWRLPLARWVGGQPAGIWLDDLLADERVARIARVLADRGR